MEKRLSVQNPGLQLYTTPGTYPVTLQVTNTSGCGNTIVHNAIIHPNPAINAGVDTTICKFTDALLHSTGADFYTWTSHPSLSCTSCAEPIAKPEKTITYAVTGKTIFGCSKEDFVTVKVLQPFKMGIRDNDTVCLGNSVVLKATGADKYQWSPSTWLNNTNTGTPKSTPTSSITYKVVGSDSLGCFEDEGSVTIKLYTKPHVEIANGESIVVQAGTPVKLTTKNSPDIVDWKWYPSKWLSCSTCAETIAAANENITYHVTAANQGHCEASDDVTISVICNNANVYVPNTFSPNHDGSNDVFYPRGTGLYTIKSFKIFNRWGQVVFSKNGISANDPQVGWDGTLNGAILQPDVYVYTLEVICQNNNILPIKGNVTLIR